MATGLKDVTELLAEWSKGNESAGDELIPLVYTHLHRLAARHMARERSDHSLQATELVNAAYLRLVDQRRARWQNRAHFFALASRIMRRILVDHARRRRYAKRGGGAHPVSLDEAVMVSKSKSADIVALDDALTSLAAIDLR